MISAKYPRDKAPFRDLFPLLDKWLDVILRLHARYPVPNFLLIKWYAVNTIKTRPTPDVKIAIARTHLSADLLLPWPVVANRKKLEIQIQLNVVIKQMSECLGDARYAKSTYALLSRSIVWSLLCYCVRDNDRCCVLCDVTRDLLFTWYIVHQPNVYQYRALIYLSSLRQGLDYLPVNSKTSHFPRVYPGHFSVQWGIWPKMRPAPSGIFFRVKMLVSVSFSVYITFKDYWRHCSYIHCFVGVFESLWSYVQTDETLLANNSQICGR